MLPRTLVLASLALLRLAAARAADETASPVVLSEILASNRRTAFDDRGRSSDWLELHNRSAAAVDLGGWTLTDDASKPQKWKLPAIRVAPDGYLVVWASGDDRFVTPLAADSRPAGDVRFAKTFVRAGDAWRYVVAHPGEPGLPEGWRGLDFDDSRWEIGPSGFGYEDNDDATVLPEGTTAVFIRREFKVDDPGLVGQLVLKVDFDDGFVAYLNGDRVAAVNSPVEHPDFTTIASDKHEPGRAEYFDLTPMKGKLRAGRNVLAIAGLNDKPSSDMSLIPELGTLPLVLHTSFRLSTKGGLLQLRSPDGKLADQAAYPRAEEDRSYGRPAGADAEWKHFLTPSPAAPNRFRAFAEVPTASVAFKTRPGFYSAPLEVEIERKASFDGLDVRYTTDGTLPGPGSEVVKEPLHIARSTVVRAAGFLGTERATPAVSASYFLGPGPALPVLSVSMDPAEFDQVHAAENGHGPAWEREAFLEVFDAGGRPTASAGFGFRLHGGYGRKGGLETKKSYRAYFRDRYGASRFEHELIPGIKKTDKLVLRAGFNDRMGSYNPSATFIRDQVLRDLHHDMGAVAPAGSWCLLYVDMKPKGVYNVVERVDKDFLREHFSGGDWDLIKTGNEVASGTRDAWDSLRRFVSENDLSRDDVYAEAARRIDLDDFTSYMILNLWSQNEDWPQNNWYAARKREEGAKWVFLSWDAEFGLGLTPTGFSAPSIRSLFARKGPVRDIFGALLENAKYRERFQAEVERHLNGALSPESVIRRIRYHRDLIDPVIADEASLFAPGVSHASWRANVDALERFARGRNKVFSKVAATTLLPQVAVDPGHDRPFVLAAPQAQASTAWIACRRRDGSIVILRKGSGAESWAKDLTFAQGGDVPAAAGPPSGWMEPGGAKLCLVYRGADGHVHEIDVEVAKDAGTARAGAHSDLTEAGKGPPAVGDPGAVFIEGDAAPHVIYRSATGQLHELWRDDSALDGSWRDGAWRHDSISIAAGSPRAAGEPWVGVSPSDKGLLVVYAGEDQQIHELACPGRRPAAGKARAWRHTNVTKTAGAAPCRGGTPCVIANGKKRTILYRGYDDQLYSCVFDTTWRFTPAASDGSVSFAGSVRSAGMSMGAGRTEDGGLAELGSKGQVTVVRLPGGAPPLASDPAGWTDFGGARSWAYRAADGSVHVLRYERGWRHEAVMGGE